MRYVANPVEVDAFKVEKVLAITHDGDICLRLEDGQRVMAMKERCWRINPSVGDYWVTQDDGDEYVIPKGVFERKYRPAQ